MPWACVPLADSDYRVRSTCSATAKVCAQRNALSLSPACRYWTCVSAVTSSREPAANHARLLAVAAYLGARFVNVTGTIRTSTASRSAWLSWGRTRTTSG